MTPAMPGKEANDDGVSHSGATGAHQTGAAAMSRAETSTSLASTAGPAAATDPAPGAPTGVVLDIRDVSKRYDSNLVLKNVALTASRGEILGLLGSNGAGKSTLLKIIAGVVPPTSGVLSVAGTSVDPERYSPRDSARLGVYTVHQELSVFTNLSVAENFAMAADSQTRPTRRRMRATAARALEDVFPGAGISPRAEVSTLSLADRQMVEIAVAASRPGLSILIMDEPTSALPASRAEQLHAYLQRRKREGVLIIYVSHKLDEIVDIVDRVVVLRDGEIAWESPPTKLTRAELLSKLGAAEEVDAAEDAVRLPETAADAHEAATLLTVRRDHPCEGQGVTFRVRAGEVVGVAGLEGAGQRPLLREIFAGRTRRRPVFDVTGGVSYVSGDRKLEGIFPLWNVLQNITVSSLHSVSRWGRVRTRDEVALGKRWYDGLGMVATGMTAPITGLSGGNQQKAVIARGIASGAAVVLLDDPTRGVDIETKSEFYSLLRALREQGRGAVLYSTEDREFDECDRVYVMVKGAIVKELKGDQISKESIVQWSYAGQGTASAPAAASGPVAARATWGRLQDAIRSRLALVTCLLAAVVIAMGLTQPSTLSTAGLDLLLEAGLPLVAAALAQMFVILAGDFDVSVGYAIGLANVICATVLVSHPLLGVLLLLGLIAAYALMATLAHVSGVPAVVITLGASFVWLGIGLTLQDVPGGSVPAWLNNVLSVQLLIVPEAVWLALGLALVAFLVLRRWRYGTVMRAFGNNRQSFADTGRSGLLARVSLYAMAGFCVVLGGAFTTVVSTASDINASSTLTLASVAAVVIGGAEFIGGVVEPIGAVMAAVALGFIPTLLYFVHIDPDYQTAVTGLILLAAMGLRRIAKGPRSWRT